MNPLKEDFRNNALHMFTKAPRGRATIQASIDPAWMAAKHYELSEWTIWKWRKRIYLNELS